MMHQMMLASLLFVMGAVSAATKSRGKNGTPPSFLLQDQSDGICLAGESFERCGIETLWYIEGSAGAYVLHKRNVQDTDKGLCLDKMDCLLDESAVSVSNCEHCGAKGWNIVGDAESGYVLTQDDNTYCVERIDEVAITKPCAEDSYSTFTLQFASDADIVNMRSDGARLVASASAGEKSAAKTLLKSGVDVNSVDWNKVTPLIAAAGKGHLDVVKLLVSYKADTNLRDKDNVTALMEAASAGHYDVVKYLAGQSAEADCVAASGVSPMWLAASAGHHAVVDFLLGKGVNPDNARDDGVTALMAASLGGHVKCVTSLLKKGADVAAADKVGLTALTSAANNGSLPIVEKLLEYKTVDVNSLSETGFTPLMVASAHGHIDVLRKLLAAEADVDADHPDNVIALMYAAAGGFADLVQVLIDAGSVIDKRHEQGGTALTEACSIGSIGAITALLDAGADVFVSDFDNINTLMTAAVQGHTDAVKLLLEKGVDVNAIAKSGGTAVMFAASGGHIDIVTSLLEAGADVNVVVKAEEAYLEQAAKALAESKEGAERHVDGVTAVNVAVQGGHGVVMRMLVEAGAAVDVRDADGMTPLMYAVKSNHAAMATYLVEHGANPTGKFDDDKGKKHDILLDAITVGNTEFALLLLEKGSDVSVSDERGVTPLTQAAYVGCADVVSALLKDPATDVNAASEEGFNPLIAASSEGHHEVVEMLLATGKVRVNDSDKDQTNALMNASVRGHSRVVALLLAAKATVNTQNVDGHTALMFGYNGKNQVETLLGKYTDYLKNQDDESIQLMRDALKSHNDVIRALLGAGADATLKDNEGHTTADFDYKSPEAEPGGITHGRLSEL